MQAHRIQSCTQTNHPTNQKNKNRSKKFLEKKIVTRRTELLVSISERWDLLRVGCLFEHLGVSRAPPVTPLQHVTPLSILDRPLERTSLKACPQAFRLEFGQVSPSKVHGKGMRKRAFRAAVSYLGVREPGIAACLSCAPTQQDSDETGEKKKRGDRA